MTELLIQIARDSLATLAVTAEGLLWPALFFLFLGMIVKRRALFTDVRRALGETSLNIQLMAFNLILVVPLISFMSQALHVFVVRGDYFIVPPAAWGVLPMWLVIFIGVFVGDFVGYWRHRLEHSPLLWPAHAVHHSDTELTWLSLERFHPINRVTTFVIDGGVLLLLGLPVEAVIANNLVRHYYGFLIHADLPWTYGPLARIFVSPAMHRWHHANDPAAYGTNYATVFSVFDRAFGTYRVPGPCDAPLGVSDPMAPTLAGQIAYAFQPRAYRGVLRGWRRGRAQTDGAEG